MLYFLNIIFKKKTEDIYIQLFRYLFVGSVSAILDISILFILTEYVNLYYLVSATLSFVIGGIVNYVLSKIWIFTKNKYQASKEILFFFIIGFIGLLFNGIVLWILTTTFNLWYILSKIIAIFIVFLWNFLARKYLLFTAKNEYK